MIQARLAPYFYGAVSALVLSACGGGGGGTATIGGTVTGLANGRTLVMQNNLTDTFSITGNGANSFTFNFATGVGAGGLYSASVQTQPLGQTCVITNGTANVDSNADNVTTIQVTCAITSTIVGTVSGLVPGVAVQLTNGTTTTAPLGNGAFSFPGVLAAGSTYTITVAQQPLNQTCTITNGTGTTVAGASSQVSVTCQ